MDPSSESGDRISISTSLEVSWEFSIDSSTRIFFFILILDWFARASQTISGNVRVFPVDSNRLVGNSLHSVYKIE